MSIDISEDKFDDKTAMTAISLEQMKQLRDYLTHKIDYLESVNGYIPSKNVKSNIIWVANMTGKLDGNIHKTGIIGSYENKNDLISALTDNGFTLDDKSYTRTIDENEVEIAEIQQLMIWEKY